MGHEVGDALEHAAGLEDERRERHFLQIHADPGHTHKTIHRVSSGSQQSPGADRGSGVAAAACAWSTGSREQGAGGVAGTLTGAAR